MLKIRKREKSFYNGQEITTICSSCEKETATMEIYVKGDRMASMNQKIPVCQKCLTGLSQ